MTPGNTRADYKHKTAFRFWVDSDCDNDRNPLADHEDAEYLHVDEQHALCKKCWEALPE